MNTEQMRELAEKAAACAEGATPGPWEVDGPRVYAGICPLFEGVVPPDTSKMPIDHIMRHAFGNMPFIAAARELVPALAAALVEAAGEIERSAAEYNDLMERYNHRARVIADREGTIESDTRHVLVLTAERDALRDAAGRALQPLEQHEWITYRRAGDAITECIECGQQPHEDGCEYAAAIAALRRARGEERGE